MVRNWCWSLLLGAIGIACHAGGGSLPAPAGRCPPRAPADAGPYLPGSNDSLPDLAGEYDLWSVYASGGPQLFLQRARLHLVATDSAFQPVASHTGASYWLAGSLVWVDTITGVPLRHADSTPYRDTVQVVSSDLYTGCRRCLDGSPVRYRIIAVNEREFWGYWEEPQGYLRVADTSGRRLPNSAGHYCARRQQ
jgi:hypothetical protein